MVWFYNDVLLDGIVIYGGYFIMMVVNVKFVVCIFDYLFKDVVVLLLCVGVMVWSFMFYFSMNVKGVVFGVVGLGGLGYMVVKFGKVFGMYVMVFSMFFWKEKEVCEFLGVDDFVVSKD